MNWKTPVTLSVLVLLLVLGVVAGWHYATQEMPSLREAAAPDEPRTECKDYASGEPLRTVAVTVNVYNTPNGRQGMAGETLRDLQDRGFVGGAVGNSDQRIPKQRVLVTSGDPRSAQVRLVVKHLRGKVPTRAAEDPEIGTDVNVYVGRRFRGLVKGAPKKVTVKGSTRVCYEIEE